MNTKKQLKKYKKSHKNYIFVVKNTKKVARIIFFL